MAAHDSETQRCASVAPCTHCLQDLSPGGLLDRKRDSCSLILRHQLLVTKHFRGQKLSTFVCMLVHVHVQVHNTWQGKKETSLRKKEKAEQPGPTISSFTGPPPPLPSAATCVVSSSRALSGCISVANHKELKDLNLEGVRMLLLDDGANPCKPHTLSL